MATAAPAQEPTEKTPADRSRRDRQTPKETVETVEKIDAERPTSDEAMRRAISNLTTQMNTLTGEVKLLRRATERNSMTIELLLYEERLAKVEEKLDAALEQKADLDAREADLKRRMSNIQQEVMLRGGLRRDEVEAAVRADIQRALEDTKNRQYALQQRIAELQAQATRLRERVETLRKKLEHLETKNEQQ
ncbi:MAG TPA: hypothetical protein VJZ26_17115 [Blastocatellia bacterium]|nr:hypothetical protein [Blastocatellia bacterium]